MTARPTAHPREDLHRFVNQLNVRYNLGINIPDPTLCLSERRAEQDLASRIYRRLEAHFYTGSITALNGLLCLFDAEAKDYWSNWVTKPNADADTLPTTAHPPLAANLTERDWLQNIFTKLLDTAQPAMQSRSFGRSQSGPAATGGFAASDISSSAVSSRRTSHASSRSTSKRRAEAQLAGLGDSVKKPRPEADADPIRDLTARSSASMRRRQPGASASGAMGPPRTTPINSNSHFRSFATTSTEISAPSAIFSEDGDAPFATQDTIEASTQEQLRPPLVQVPDSCSQDPYEVTSSLEADLYTSFDQYQRGFVKPGAGVPVIPASTSLSEIASSWAPEVERELHSHVSNLETKSQAKTHSLSDIWPSFPSWLRAAPFPIAWEVTRIGQSCNVDLESTSLIYKPEWRDQVELRSFLRRHAVFQGKTFPAASSDAAWAAALRSASPGTAGVQQPPVVPLDQEVVYTASLDFGSRSSKALQLTMQPLKLEQSHRLGRRYGSHRFLELLLPSPDYSNLPASLKDDLSFFDTLISWLKTRHAFCGRLWAAFYCKSGGSRKPVKDIQFGPQPRPVFKDRIFFFAESSEADPNPKQFNVRLSLMVKWALEIDRRENGRQPVLKLFQRLALVLSRTSPAMVFEPKQMRHLNEDVLSPTGSVMNDGCGRMSPAVARQIRTSLGLTVIPSAVQGRLGSAKGMWIVDTSTPASHDEIWIETYPSQRKWALDWNAADKEHRTLEIRNFSSLPKSANFNLQFLPVIEDRAKNKVSMRKDIGNLLNTNLFEELQGQKRALQSPLEFRQWVYENASHKHDRIILGHIPFQGGMPKEDEEVMNMMLDAGFDPKSNKHLNKITYEVQKRKCEMLMKKLNITVGRSAYLYMVVDFAGVLEEDEVHVGFSTAFNADDDWSGTMIHGTDVLVARSPAHFISDIQRVRAVFRPELAPLKDVIVFSSKGNVPLAEKLSGGDYDGDFAWCCWDSRIVNNFQNAPVQEQPDLSEYMPKDKETFRDLVKKHGKFRSIAVDAMMAKSFSFNLQKSMLGTCTNYKERLCYERNSVSDGKAVHLSMLLSNLVDQAKQGMQFGQKAWARFLCDLELPSRVGDPAYKQDHWLSRERKPQHIIDYLKFAVAKPTVEKELKNFHAALNDEASGGAVDWDEDLAFLHKNYEGQTDSQFRSTLGSESNLLKCLKEDIEAVKKLWDRGSAEESFPGKVERIWPMWQDIQPREGEKNVLSSRTSSKALKALDYGSDYSYWKLLKASTAFWMYCNEGNKTTYGRKPRFVWQMACLQLCYIKALAVAKKDSHGIVGAPRAVVPSIYAGLRPDAKYVKTIAARRKAGSHFGLGGEDDDEAELMMEHEV